MRSRSGGGRGGGLADTGARFVGNGEIERCQKNSTKEFRRVGDGGLSVNMNQSQRRQS